MKNFNALSRYNLNAQDAISLVGGDSELIMKKDGAIDPEGKNITVKGSGTMHIKVNGDVAVKGKKVRKNLKIEVVFCYECTSETRRPRAS